MALEDNGIFGEEKTTATIRERLFIYLANWPIFLICLLACVGSGVFYNRYTVPKYMATTSFLVKGIEGSFYSNDLVDQAVNGKEPVNVNNEMLTISSPGLMQRTVVKNSFNISYFKKGRLLTLNIYEEAPFRLFAQQIIDSSRTYSIHIVRLHIMGGSFLYGPEEDEKSVSFRWNVPFSISGQTFVLAPKRTIRDEEGEYIVRWQSVRATASQFINQLIVKPFDTKTSVLEMSFKTENLELGKDVLNALFAEFHLSDIEDRDRLSESTMRFVDERLVTISNELKGVEGNLENYQGSNQLIDINEQSSQYLANSNEVSKTIKDISIQQGVVEMIKDYFSKPTNSNKLVPSSLGLNDATLALLIGQYNELQLRKDREAPMIASSSTVMIDLNTQLDNLKSSIFESLNNITKNLKLQENNFQLRNNQYWKLLSSMPHNERVLQEIKRKQSITEGLYLFLLQKREQVAFLSTAINVSHYKQIDLASGYGPVEPNSRNILLYTSLLGISLAVGWIYLRGLLNDKISGKDDITNRISLPLIGQINHIPTLKKQPVSVLERNITGEQFRALRTSLSFFLKNKNKPVILVTSCASNEGKSFVSLNLAAVCALPGKKVALLEFDANKSTTGNNLKIKGAMGLTDYITGKTNGLLELSYSIKDIPTLHIYPYGSVPSYPADMLLTENISHLFELLKERYDYIIVDSPPAELVSDAFILGQFSDSMLFVIRQGTTLKKQLDFIKDADHNNKLSNTALVLNDVKTSKKFGYFYYRYGQYKQTINRYKFKIVG